MYTVTLHFVFFYISIFNPLRNEQTQICFPGRTEEDMFSSTLYRFGLHGSGRWETVQPTGGKPPATAGHSMVFHGPSRTLLVYGGHRPTTARCVPSHTLEGRGWEESGNLSFMYKTTSHSLKHWFPKFINYTISLVYVILSIPPASDALASLTFADILCKQHTICSLDRLIAINVHLSFLSQYWTNISPVDPNIIRYILSQDLILLW